MAAQRMDELLARLGQYRSSEPRRHAGVMFDPRNGLGGVPDAANIDYRGFMAYMRPGQFLQVNPPRDLATRPVDHIRAAIDAGEPIGTPMLYVDRTPDGWRVRGHEGRGRMTIMQERAPRALLPVAVHPLGEIRARHLKPEDVLSWIRPDEGGSLPTRPRVAILDQRPYAAPTPSEIEQWSSMYTPGDIARLVEELPPR
jgi:hypothetical protein